MDRHDVAIVGAGAAGIAAARALAAAGLAVVLIEASARLGGRAWTETIAGMPLDLGCGWLHSADRNPLVGEAVAIGRTVDRSPAAWRQQLRGLGFPAAEQDDANAAWEAFVDRIETAPPASDRAADALPPGGRWNAYAEALSGYMNGANLDSLSVADFLAYEHAATDENWRMPEGYGALVAALAPRVETALCAPVSRIAHRDGGLAIDTARGTVRARAAIVTVSTGVLAAGAIAFEPAIDAHRHAAACVPLGLADKIFLALDDGDAIGVPPESHMLGDPHDRCTGSYYLRPFGRPVIECFFGGAGARAIEAGGMAAGFDVARAELEALLGSAIRPRLIPLIGSAWGRMDGFLGSYSHALPGCADARAVLREPASDRLFFAGEATHPTDFSTAHGAWQSGLRAAEEVRAALVR